ncbi:MAG TPA: Sir2 family NAD-dependent protein deacetylase [Streptosporangiaceae bacterium]|nr:Sir2 family NAD-dependent protein deacetylase [Streptosporangiaceae bacterium]
MSTELPPDGPAEAQTAAKTEAKAQAGTGAVPDWARGVRAVTVLTGAGISTDSGIPDFRGPQGVWTKDPAAEKLSTYQDYMADPEVRRRAWQSRLRNPAWTAEPNPAHRAVARLARSAVDTQVITQNTDELHQRAGTPPERVIELHGTMFRVVCTTCESRGAMTDALNRVRAGEPDPPCALCGGILKSATVMFGQALPPGMFERAATAAGRCELFLAIGSTLIVQPAASLCAIAVKAGANLVVVNGEPTPYDRVATAVIRDPIGSAVPRIVGQVLAASTP